VPSERTPVGVPAIGGSAVFHEQSGRVGAPLVIGHRGLPDVAPENTLAGFRAAAAAGVRWVETDVDVLADGTAVLIHDPTLDRTTDRTGSYHDLAPQQLANVDAGGWFHPRFAGEPVPTLTQFVDLLNEVDLNANLELKGSDRGATHALRLIESVVAELDRLRPERRVIVSSFNHLMLARFAVVAPRVPLACLWETSALYDDWRSVVELVGAELVHPEDTGLTRARVEEFLSAGFGVNVWTVNDHDRANELLNWGVTGIITDRADQFRHLVPTPTDEGVS
jgi:glycerophosphoryl diester phosphodiesterase